MPLWYSSSKLGLERGPGGSAPAHRAELLHPRARRVLRRRGEGEDGGRDRAASVGEGVCGSSARLLWTGYSLEGENRWIVNSCLAIILVRPLTIGHEFEFEFMRVERCKCMQNL